MEKIDQLEVDIGFQLVSVPVWRQNISQSKYNILITAGMDGDEYTSIDAAYQLIDDFSRHSPGVKLTIIPIVNVPGFEHKLSLNPMDGKYPKFVFPGKNRGTSTEKLMHWLSEFVFSTDIWIDLHGGALDEYLIPFTYLSCPRDSRLRNQTDKLALNLHNGTLIYDKKNSWDYSVLRKKNIIRVVIEAGYSGLRQKSMIRYHTDQVKKIINLLLNSAEPAKMTKNAASFFTGVAEIKAFQKGLWYPLEYKYKDIKKNQILGLIKSSLGKTMEIVKAKNSGTFLWGKSGSSCDRGDTLVGLARS